MATEVRQPDGDIATGDWTTTPLWSKINEGSGSPDGVYIVCPGNKNSAGECSVQDPTNGGAYTGVELRAYVRKGAAGGNQRGLDGDIRINTALQGQKTFQANLGENFTQYIQTWTGLSFTQAEMNSLQVLFISTGTTGGAPSGRREVHIDYYEIVLTYTPSGTTYYQNVGEGAISPSADISKMTSKPMGGGTIAPTALLSRLTSKLMGEGAVTPTGALAKSMFVVAGDGAITPTGQLTSAALFAEAVGQGAIDPVGELIKKTSIAVGGGAVSPSGALSNLVRKMVGGGAVVISGALGRIATFTQAVGGGAVIPSGVLSSTVTYIKTVGGGIVTPVGTLVKKSFLAVGGGTIAATAELIAQKLGGGTIKNLYSGGFSAANRFMRRGWH